eukprot:11228357-Lingulodinium_polyedra.AAC.4
MRRTDMRAHAYDLNRCVRGSLRVLWYRRARASHFAVSRCCVVCVLSMVALAVTFFFFALQGSVQRGQCCSSRSKNDLRLAGVTSAGGVRARATASAQRRRCVRLPRRAACEPARQPQRKDGDACACLGVSTQRCCLAAPRPEWRCARRGAIACSSRGGSATTNCALAWTWAARRCTGRRRRGASGPRQRDIAAGGAANKRAAQRRRCVRLPEQRSGAGAAGAAFEPTCHTDMRVHVYQWNRCMRASLRMRW